LNESAPVGRIINSYISRLFPACAPPLMILRDGTGIINLFVGFPASNAIY
jgi:hypothetical protein